MLLRSLLFVPGHRSDMLAKAPGRGSDVLILDLEDGVPPSQKDSACQVVGDWLRSKILADGPALFVRLNPLGDRTERELAAAVCPAVAGLCLPKVESARQIATLASMIDAAEVRTGVEIGSTRILPLIESALGLLNAFQIAGESRRVIALAFGSEDYALDLGAQRTKEGSEIAFGRSHMVVSARAAGVGVIDGIFTDLTDDEGLRRDVALGKQMGFDGKQVIHPKQVPAVNQGFLPTEAEMVYAEKVVAAFDEALKAGTGAILVDGKMVDAPVALRARRTVEIARRAHRDG